MGRATTESKRAETRPEARRTLVFAKRPLPGRVKTRLCPPLSPEQAAHLARAMLDDALERCLDCPDFRTTLAFAPAGELAWFEANYGGRRGRSGVLALRAQEGASLAERMAQAFASELGLAGSVVAIGSDQPLVASARIAAAHAALEAGADVVLGPDAGGGYYLIGMRASHPELFLHVPMSTSDNFAASVAQVERLGLTLARLEPGYDVDVEADLLRLTRDLAALDESSPGFPRRTAACLREALFLPRP
jgi:rSAM/selenodomain-associated transferase 1